MSTATAWVGYCTTCGDKITVHVIAPSGRPLDVDLDPTRFRCLQCRDPRQAGRQLELDDEPDVFGTGRVEQITYPPDMVALPEGF